MLYEKTTEGKRQIRQIKVKQNNLMEYGMLLTI
jgi:hypothetical protein